MRKRHDPNAIDLYYLQGHHTPDDGPDAEVGMLHTLLFALLAGNAASTVGLFGLLAIDRMKP